jgi:tetratricopeptide (TPR) repeat protein
LQRRKLIIPVDKKTPLNTLKALGVSWLNQQPLKKYTTSLIAASLLLSAVGLPGEAVAGPKKRATRRAAPAASSAIPADNPNMSPLDHNNKGVQYGQRGAWEQAISEHEIALNGDPFNTSFKTNLSAALLRYGQALAAKKDWGKAIHELREAQYVDPNNADAANLLDKCLQATGKDPSQHMKMGDDLETEGNYPEAIAEYRRNLHGDDGGPAHAALGRALVKQGSQSPGRLVEGYEEMRIAVSKTWDPSQQNDLAAVHQKLGDILKEEFEIAKRDGRKDIALKRLSTATVEYRRSVQLNPANLDAIRSLIEVCREAVTIKPSFDNHLMLGSAYLLLGDFDRAKQQFEECNKIDPNSDALEKARKSYHWHVAASSQHPELLPKTMSIAEEKLRRNPNDPEWLYIWGMGKAQMGDKEMALKAYTKAYTINPALPKLKENIAAIQGGVPASGSKPADPTKTPPGTPAAAGTPGAPGTTGAAGTASGAGATAAGSAMSPQELAAISSAENKFRNGDLDGALKDATDMTIANTGNARAWGLVGAIMQKKGNLDEASVAYRQAALLKLPGAAEACRQLDSIRVHPQLEEADKQYATGDFVHSAASLREALSIAPNLPILHRKLADCLEKLGDSKEAKRERDKAIALEKEN